MNYIAGGLTIYNKEKALNLENPPQGTMYYDEDKCMLYIDKEWVNMWETEEKFINCKGCGATKESDSLCSYCGH